MRCRYARMLLRCLNYSKKAVMKRFTSYEVQTCELHAEVPGAAESFKMRKPKSCRECFMASPFFHVPLLSATGLALISALVL